MSEQATVHGEPAASRPYMKGYGVPADPEGMLPWSHVAERMAGSRNYWICTTRPDGRPHAMPVWGLWLDETLYFGTGRDTVKARNLAANPAVVVHLESGDDMVVIEGVAEEITPDPALAQRLADASEAKYNLSNDPNESAGPTYVLRPHVAFAWLEKDFVKTATRWVFARGGVEAA